MMRTFFPCLVTALLTPLGLGARAQQQPLLSDEQALQEERTPEERFRKSSDPHEALGQSYFFLGARYRFAVLPPFLMRAYAVTSDRAVRTGKAAVAELGYRRGGFQVLANAGFLKLDLDGPFRLRRDPSEDTEWLDARFKSLLLTAAFTWSTSFTDWLQLEYGFEAGAAVLFGDLTRTEAVRRADGKWERCRAWASVSPNPADMLGHNPLSPNPSPEEVRYCERPRGDDPTAPPPDSDQADEAGAHYGVKAKRGLRQGGVPRVLPVLGPRLSLRFKPARQVVLRVDVPLPVFPFGFMGGVSAQFGF